MKENKTILTKPTIQSYRSRRFILIFAVFIIFCVVALVVVISSKRFNIASLPLPIKEQIPAELVTQIKSDCYEQNIGRYQSAVYNYPETAKKILDQSPLDALPQIFRTIIESTGEDPYAQKPVTELAAAVKDFYVNLAQISYDTAQCYVTNLSQYPQALKRAKEATTKTKETLDYLQSFDYVSLFEQRQNAQALLTLQPRETQTVRLRTYCIDSFALPPRAGSVYLLAGSVDELQRSRYCDLLRQGQTADPSETQKLVWGLELEHRDTNSTTTPPQAGTTKLVEAKSANQLSITAVATGTLTDLDVTFSNLSNQTITLDTSCAYFLPVAVPLSFVTKQIMNERVLGYRGFNFGSVDVSQINLDDFEPAHPAQAGGILQQAVGTSGVIGPAAPLQPELPPLEPIVKDTNYTKLAESNLDQSWDNFQSSPTAENLTDLIESLNACRALGCSQTGIVKQQMDAFVEQMIDETMQNYQKNPDEITYQEAMEALRLCLVLGCDPTEALVQMEAAQRNHLKKIKENPE